LRKYGTLQPSFLRPPSRMHVTQAGYSSKEDFLFPLCEQCETSVLNKSLLNFNLQNILKIAEYMYNANTNSLVQ